MLARAWARRILFARLLHILGLLALLTIPLTSKRLYLDEKALLVGLSTPLSAQAVPGVADGAVDLARKGTFSDLPSMFEHAQEKLNAPASGWHGSVSSNGCATAHTVVPGRRSDGTEALLLAFPIDRSNVNAASIAVPTAIAIAHHFSERRWLAKDLIVVALDTTNCTALATLEAWLDNVDRSEDLRTFGLIQQGLVLDIAAPGATEARLGVHGRGGQLPNMDMVSLTKRTIDMFTKLNVGLDVGGAPANRITGAAVEWQEGLHTALAFAVKAASGRATGAHAALLLRSIDAVTVSLTDAPGRFPAAELIQSAAEHTAGQALTIAEMVMVACNNLQERLHHSSALYVLASAEHFVGIGVYIVPPALLLAALLLRFADVLHAARFGGPVIGWSGAVAGHMALLTTAAAWAMQTGDGLWPAMDYRGVMASMSGVAGLGLSLLKQGPLWAAWLECTSTGTITHRGKEGEESWNAFLPAFYALLLTESAALLLLNWALCFCVLAVALLGVECLAVTRRGLKARVVNRSNREKEL